MLEGADLRRARWQWVWLRRVALRGCDLRRADLRGARLENVSLEASRLEGADLSNAELVGIRLDGTLYDRHTRWPGGFDPERHGARLVE